MDDLDPTAAQIRRDRRDMPVGVADRPGFRFRCYDIPCISLGA
jgi:hypothetical protein